MQHAAPRNYTAPTALPGAGLAHERSARIAQRRAFVELKSIFMRAVEGIDPLDDRAAWLQRQVRHAHEPEDLWLLRSAVFAVLRRDPVNGPRMRHELRRCLDTVFPGTFFYSGFTGF